MRKTLLVLGVIILAGIAGTSLARADSPWCIADSEFGYPGDCSYQTREQCLFSVSGRKGYCLENPRFILRSSPQQTVPLGRRVSPY